MGKHDFEPKPGWNSARDDVVNDFYRSALRNCSRYDRLTGFFSSNVFAVALRETLDFVGRSGRIRLMTSATFSQKDLEAITKSVEERLSEETERILEDDLGKKCLAIFSRMLTAKIGGASQLEIKILVPHHGMFHPKVGIFTMDDGSAVSFSGSVNETGMGWASNVEEFKAFCSWIDPEYVDLDRETFRTFWNDEHADIRTYDLPTAVREKILSVRPRSDSEYDEIVDEVRMMLYGERRRAEKGISLRGYQKDAVLAWTSRGHRGILEMPTGTGKTFTAMGCINRMQKDVNRLFTIIVVPYTHLARQWLDNVKKWNEDAEPEQRVSANSLNTVGNPSWKDKLGQAVVAFNKKRFGGGHMIDGYILCTTYDTLASKAFRERIRNVEGKILLVADEAHHAGAKTSRNGLLDLYHGRLALTATPERYFDEEGSDLIRSYFGDVVYFMKMNDAIRGGYLVPYDYYPRFVEMTSDETAKYAKLTHAIAMKLAGKRNEEESDNGERNSPENKRATLIAKMEKKYGELEAILDERGNRLENALIYCHDTEQLEAVEGILSRRNIIFDEITSAYGMIERRDKIRSLERKDHQCIVSMKCLDEGVDIPSARLGIILASTGNTRQYIQRRGRLLRRFESKNHAEIYDLLAMAVPEADGNPFARKLVAKELLRHKEFADGARNRSEALEKIRPVAERFGIDIDRLNLDYVLDL